MNHTWRVCKGSLKILVLWSLADYILLAYKRKYRKGKLGAWERFSLESCSSCVNSSPLPCPRWKMGLCPPITSARDFDGTNQTAWVSFLWFEEQWTCVWHKQEATSGTSCSHKRQIEVAVSGRDCMLSSMSQSGAYGLGKFA